MHVVPHIDGYEIVRQIGRGGSARVYHARELDLDRDVAIKVVDGTTAEWLKRMETEARALAKLHHPHIVELYRFGRLGADTLYYVMPLLSGGDLSTWLKPVPEEQVLNLLNQLLPALASAHDAGIIHRDIKPENILFDVAQQRAQLADFGAIVVRGENRTTLEGHTLGSVGYMSPEQARGMALTPASDLYSLAVLAFELLTGFRPHDGSDVLAIALAQIESAPKPLPSALAHWQAFFDRALAPTVSARFASADAMRAALPTALAEAVTEPNSAIQLAPQSASTKLAATQILAVGASKYRSPIRLFALLGVLFAIGFLGFYLWSSAQQSRAEYLRLRGELAVAPLLADAQQLSAARQLQLARALNAGDRAQLVQALAMRYQQALIALGFRDQRAIALLRELAVLRTQSESMPTSTAYRDWIAESTRQMQQQLQLAIRRFDSKQAAIDIDTAKLLLSDVPTLQADIAQAMKIPKPGEQYLDATGLTMRLIQAPSAQSPGLSIMAQPLLDVEFQRYRAQLSTALASKLEQCATAVSKVRSCVELDLAQRIVQWLNAQLPTNSGRSFQIPSAELWQRAGDAVPKLDNAFALSPDCNWVVSPAAAASPAPQKSNIVRRTWGGVRRVFGADPRVSTKPARRCEGQLRYPLSGGAQAAKPVPADALKVLVLVQRISY